ncbi:MAG: DUF805 domain-containing protein [Hellea sp.]
MNFIDSVRICFLEFAVFKGRSRRSEFWWFQLFAIIGTFGADFIDTTFLGYDELSYFTPLATTFDAVTLLPLTAVAARRLHDVGMSGWFQAPTFLFYLFYLEGVLPEFVMTWAYVAMGLAGIYFLWILFKYAKDSDPGMNAYGHNPKDPDMGTVFD